MSTASTSGTSSPGKWPPRSASVHRMIGIHRSDMVAVLGGLTEAGHVERAPDPDDRRRNIVTLTRARPPFGHAGEQLQQPSPRP